MRTSTTNILNKVFVSRGNEETVNFFLSSGRKIKQKKNMYLFVLVGLKAKILTFQYLHVLYS